MSAEETVKKKKGGRSQKAVKRNEYIGVKCTLYEKKAIAIQARAAGLRPSEYLRTMGVNGKIDSSKFELAKEVLSQKATLNHTAENINQYTRKLNSTGILSVEERIFYRNLSMVMKEAALLIKNKLL